MKPKISDNSKLIFQSDGRTIDVNGPVGKAGELTRRGQFTNKFNMVAPYRIDPTPPDSQRMNFSEFPVVPRELEMSQSSPGKKLLAKSRGSEADSVQSADQPVAAIPARRAGATINKNLQRALELMVAKQAEKDSDQSGSELAADEDGEAEDAAQSIITDSESGSDDGSIQEDVPANAVYNSKKILGWSIKAQNRKLTQKIIGGPSNRDKIVDRIEPSFRVSVVEKDHDGKSVNVRKGIKGSEYCNMSLSEYHDQMKRGSLFK